MKAESTIRRQIAKLRRIAQTTNSQEVRFVAYDAEHALRWVVGESEATPEHKVKAIERYVNEKGEG